MARNRGAWLWCQQLRAVTTKRMLYAWRSPFITAMQVLVTASLTLLCCLLRLVSVESWDDQPAMTLTLRNYRAPVAPYEGAQKVSIVPCKMFH